MAVQAFEYQMARPVRVPVEDLPSGFGEPARSGRRHLRVVREDERANRPRLRLTRRGRLVRTLLVFGALSLLSLMAVARWTSPDLPPTHSVVVQQGQSLSQIAAQELPMVPTETASLRIRIANGLNSSVVMDGQSLVIPGAE